MIAALSTPECSKFRAISFLANKIWTNKECKVANVAHQVCADKQTSK